MINRLGAFTRPSAWALREGGPLPRRAWGALGARRPSPRRPPPPPPPPPPSPPFQERIEKISTDLAVDKNWRIRHSAMLLLPKLAAELGQTDLDKFVATTDGPHPVGFSAARARARPATPARPRGPPPPSPPPS